MTLGEAELKAIEAFWADPKVAEEATTALVNIGFLADDVNFIQKADNMIVKVRFTVDLPSDRIVS